MHVRTTTPQDLRIILEMRMALFQEAGEIMAPAQREEVLQANEAFFTRPTSKFETWVAEDGDQIVGAGTLAFFERPPYPGNLTGKEAYLLNMYTKPEHRSRGIAKAILKEALAYARGRGVSKVWLHATAAGRSIYQAAGFSPASSYMELTIGDA